MIAKFVFKQDCVQFKRPKAQRKAAKRGKSHARESARLAPAVQQDCQSVNSGNEYNRTRKCNTCSEQGQVKTINNGNRDENNKLRMAKIKERIRCAENVESLILRDSVQHLERHDESVVSLITMPRCVSLQKPHIKKKNSA